MKVYPDSYNASVRRIGKANTDRILAQRMGKAQPPKAVTTKAASGDDKQSPARALSDEAEAREVLAGCFVLLDRLLKQVEANAAAQATTAHALSEGIKQVARLADTLAAPRTREGVVELPSGKVKMTIRESRSKN